MTSPCSLLQIPGKDARPDLSTEVAAEPERERTPDNRPVVGFTRGERVAGTEGEEVAGYGVGERTVGINRRNGGPPLGLAMTGRQSQCSQVTVSVTDRDSNVTQSMRVTLADYHYTEHATNAKEK